MLTRRVIHRVMRMDAQLGEPGVPVPRDELPSSYYAHQNWENIKRSKLETEAKAFANWKITKKGNLPFDPFSNPERLYKIVQYMVNRDYVIPPRGRTAKSFMSSNYEFTSKGRKWARSR